MAGNGLSSQSLAAWCYEITPNFCPFPALATLFEGIHLGVTTGLTSPSLPYFAVKPFILLRDVEVPEGIPLAIEVGGS